MTIGTESTTTPRRKPSRVVIIAVVGVVIATIVIVLVMVTRQSTGEDFSRTQDLVTDLEKKASSLIPSRDAYFSSLTKASREALSVPEAESASKDALEDFLSKEAAVTAAIAALLEAPAAENADVGPAIVQLTDAAAERTRYLGSLVRQYPEFRALFGDEDNSLCSDIFVGDTESFAERSEKILAATPDCLSALADLRDAGNATYVDFAVQIERRITWLEEDSLVAAEAEAAYTSFESELQPIQRAEAELTARAAPDEEFDKLLAEAKALNEKIAESKAVFEYAVDRYVRAVDEIPDIFEAALLTGVEERIIYFDAVSEVRISAARTILDDKAGVMP